MAAIDQIRVSGVAVDEDGARRTLREQIARLERELSTISVTAYPRLDTRGFRPLGEHPQGNLAPWASVPQFRPLGEHPQGNLAPWASVPQFRPLGEHPQGNLAL